MLALDGGGIRGVFTLTVLEQIERQLRAETGDDDLRLGQYFDYIGGTSTGAIIATMLSWGMPVEQVMANYIEQSKAMFRKQSWYQRHKYKFQAAGLTSFFQSTFVEDDGSLATLGTEKLKSKLLVVTRNATTGSPWPLTNNPDAKYNDRNQLGCNLDLPLWQIVRASTAAPSFFPPEVFVITGEGDFSKGEACAFEDGGVTPYNNPAYLLYLKATLPEYRTNWDVGTDKLSLVSIGTGLSKTGRAKSEINLLQTATSLPTSLITSFSQYQDLLCRSTGACQFGASIDSEVGQMLSDEGDFLYARYDHLFTKKEEAEAARRAGGGGFSLDNLGLVPFLLEFGRDYAAKSVDIAHFCGKETV